MHQTPTRILAIDPTNKGLGYVVLEEPSRLIASGLARVEGEKHAGAIAQFEKLLADFRPDAVALEDTEAPGSRRRHRVRRLIDALLALARERGCAVHALARSAVIEHFSSWEERATKYSIAQRLAKDFPELAHKLPPPRKLWESEDERMAIFDALALAVTHMAE